MDTKAAISQLFSIVSKQQTVISKLAQAQGVPAADPRTAQLQEVLFAAQPGLRSAFIEPPTVLTSADSGAKLVVAFKYHMASGQGNAIKAAVDAAASKTLGAGSYLLQGIGA
jgi:hypothetical protein